MPKFNYIYFVIRLACLAGKTNNINALISLESLTEGKYLSARKFRG